MDALTVITPGPYTTVQDRGRFGFQHMGVPVSGALDSFALMCANLLVGNPENTAVLEITFTGPSLEIGKEMDLALTGAGMPLMVNKKPVGPWRSVRVQKGDVVSIGQAQTGCRAYLAVSGGFDVPLVMGSCSTYAGGGIGGFYGRPLKAGDRLSVGDSPLSVRDRVVPAESIPDYPSDVVLRAVKGPQDDYFDLGLEPFFSTPYTVTPNANRMGYRLSGNAVPIKAGMPQSIISEPSMPGSIQIPPDEQPIILLVEQTVGGYAKIATIVSVDLPKVAQLIPGNTVRFSPVALSAAHTLAREQEHLCRDLKKRLVSTH